MQDKQLFIAAISEDEPGLRVFGPFGSEDTAVRFGRRWQNEHGDDPRWNTFWATPGGVKDMPVEAVEHDYLVLWRTDHDEFQHTTLTFLEGEQPGRDEIVHWADAAAREDFKDSGDDEIDLPSKNPNGYEVILIVKINNAEFIY